MTEARGRFAFRRKWTRWLVPLSPVLILLAIAVRVELSFYRQQLAIREIRQGGGEVEIEPAGPKWLRAWTGDECWKHFGEVQRVRMPFSEEIDFHLRHFNALRPTPPLYLTDGPPIHQYVLDGKLGDAIAAIIRYRSLIYACDDGDRTPLHVAVSYNDFELPQELEMAEFLIQQGADVNAANKHGDRPLHDAREPEMVRLRVRVRRGEWTSLGSLAVSAGDQ